MEVDTLSRAYLPLNSISTGLTRVRVSEDINVSLELTSGSGGGAGAVATVMSDGSIVIGGCGGGAGGGAGGGGGGAGGGAGGGGGGGAGGGAGGGGGGGAGGGAGGSGGGGGGGGAGGSGGGSCNVFTTKTGSSLALVYGDILEWNIGEGGKGGTLSEINGSDGGDSYIKLNGKLLTGDLFLGNNPVPGGKGGQISETTTSSTIMPIMSGGSGRSGSIKILNLLI